jgi:hypothetical protein
MPYLRSRLDFKDNFFKFIKKTKAKKALKQMFFNIICHMGEGLRKCHVLFEWPLRSTFSQNGIGWLSLQSILSWWNIWLRKECQSFFCLLLEDDVKVCSDELSKHEVTFQIIPGQVTSLSQFKVPCLPWLWFSRCQFHQHSTDSFYAQRSQKRKKMQLSHWYLFTLSGSASVEALCWTLMKLSPGCYN